MKAVQIMSFGTADVLRINDVDRPAPGVGEVLVSVGATGVNGHDVIVRAGEVKMMSGRRFLIGVGLDFAGTVAATGADVESQRSLPGRSLPGPGRSPAPIGALPRLRIDCLPMACPQGR
ncbi:alcohol dehydrogenase catalytic domain-containing protein [Streptomyces phaeochromogenes]|uniref:alcohol dehydrogenase catalytic domain-containing protein n=1 Tax=Streptomyces phaeochromogenes TaxID=1923 RepID=UPI00386C11F4|nr:hypothetical protein OG277_23900 [Streptomyces phaeochromogenes]